MKEIKEFVKSKLKNYSAGHAWDHTKRVYNMCLNIAENEKVNLTVLKLAALLHDIGRKEQDESKGKICHAEIGTDISERFLTEKGYSKEIIDQVKHCIISHRSRNTNKPDTNEAKILFDADKLDGIGAVGIGRSFMFAQNVGAKLHNPEIKPDAKYAYTIEDTAYHEYLYTYQHLKEKLYTNKAKDIASKRLSYIKDFFERMTEEMKGNK